MPYVRTTRSRPLQERFEEKVRKTRGCWRWLGGKTWNGYGLIWSPEQRKMIYAHRVSYELYVGPIPEGNQVDHLKPPCKYEDCVRPDHLEAVTQAENLRRSNKRRWDRVRREQARASV